MATNRTASDDKLDVQYDDDLSLNLADMATTGERRVLRTGTYPAEVVSVEFGESKAGRPQLRWVLRTVTDDESTNNVFCYYYTVLDSKVGQSRAASAIARINPEADLSEVRMADVSEFVEGHPCRVRVKKDKYQGQDSHSVQDILAPASDNGGSWLA